ncbi:hypothetical protein [Sporomusa malonica]|nr:hypothetical protein [Sporomusa malonica]
MNRQWHVSAVACSFSWGLIEPFPVALALIYPGAIRQLTPRLASKPLQSA